MKELIVKGLTSHLIEIFVLDSSKTDGSGLTGLAFGDAGLVAYYYRSGAAGETAITLATMTLGTWATGGFIEIDAINMPGYYQISVPDAAFASGVDKVNMIIHGAANMAPVPIEIQLTDINVNDGAAGGMSRLDVAVSSRNSVIPPSVTQFNARTILAASYGLEATNQLIKTQTDKIVDGGATEATLTARTILAANYALEATSQLIQAKTDNLPVDPADQSDIIAATDALAALITARTLLAASYFNPSAQNVSLTAAAITAIWDEALNGHTTANTPGLIMRQLAGWIAADGTVSASPAPTTTEFTTDIISGSASFFSDQTLMFTSGVLEGQARVIISDDGAGKFIFDEAFSFAPGEDDFIIQAGHVHPISEITAAIFAGADVDGFTFEQFMKLMLASLSKISGAATATNTFRAADDSKDRITATVDANGNRSAVTFDAAG